MTQMHIPLLIPHRIQGDFGDLSQGRCKIRSPEGAEALLRLRGRVWVSRVLGDVQRLCQKVRHEVSLVEFVDVREGGKPAPVMEVARGRVWLVRQACRDAVLRSEEHTSE